MLNMTQPLTLEQLTAAFMDRVTKAFADLPDILKNEDDLKKMSDEQKTRRAKRLQSCSRRNLVKRFIQDNSWRGDMGLSYREVIDDLIDSITFEEVRQLIPAVMSEVMIEAAEPEYVLTRLVPTIEMPTSLAMEFPMIGTIYDAEEVGPGQEYPVRKFGISSQGIVRMGKFGLRVEIQDEAIKGVPGWDVFGFMLRAAGKAMARTKEKKVAAHILNNGLTVFDNLSSNYQNTSGVSPSGSQNGTFTLDDLTAMMGALLQDGLIPDTLIISGMAWTVFARVPELREFVQLSGGGPIIDWPQGKGGVHPATAARPMSQIWTSAPELSTMFVSPQNNILGRSIRTVVSPYMRYTAVSGSTPALCDIIVADSRYIGAILQKEGVTTEDFNDPRIDVRSVKFREYYAVATMAQGKGIRVARNVAIQRGLDPFNVTSFQLSGQNLQWPPRTTAIQF